MAKFIGRQVYMRNLARDVAYGTNVKGLSSVAAADTNFTVTFTSTTTATQTVQPYTNISQVTDDNRTTHGWAINQNLVSNDAMASTATAKRIIPAGTWNFSFGWTSSTATLSSSYSVVVSYHVYRVAANGGARSLLFSASAASVTVGLDAGNGTAAASSTQPEYIIQPDETIHVAVQIQSAASTFRFGNAKASVITCSGATAGAFSVSFPTPGIRTLYYDTSSAVGSGQGSKSLLISKDTVAAAGSGQGSKSLLISKDTVAAAGVGRGLISKMAMYYRSWQAVASGTGSRNILTVIKMLAAQGRGLGQRRLFVRKDARLARGNGLGLEKILVRKDTRLARGDGLGYISRQLNFFRSYTSVGRGTGLGKILVRKDTRLARGDGVGSIERRLNLFRSFQAVGNNAATIQKQIRKDIISSAGTGTGSLEKAAIFVRNFNAIGSSTNSLNRAEIFVRSFAAVGKATIHPRIGLDWNRLNTYRPLFVFDD